MLGEFPNSEAGFGAWLSQVRSHAKQAGADTLHLVLEPTGGYELPLAFFANEHDLCVSRPNPKQVRDFAKGRGQRAKTDRQDALLLAHFGAERQPPRWVPLAAEVSELESLLERRRELEQMLAQERRRKEALARRPHVGRGVPESIDTMIETLSWALSEVEEAIREHQRQHEGLAATAKQLRSVPGVGERMALPLLVLLHRFATLTGGRGEAKGVVAFAGLDPQTYESGTSVRGRGTISRRGDRRLRPLLYMGALGGVHGNNALRAFYQRLVKRGKAKKVALVAAARKILVWAWAVFRDHVDFQASRCQAATPVAA
jgi:transposase